MWASVVRLPAVPRHSSSAEVCTRRLHNMNMRQRQQPEAAQLLHYMLNRERARHHPAVGRDTLETRNCRLSGADAFGARETGVPP
jgi:hypothetical protein